jgi:phosphatidylinositol glycan class N
MASKKLDLKLFLIGFIVHLIILYSIFDIYFNSPLVHGMEPIESLTEQPPAKRLVLFVADGLRADSFFNTIDRNNALFLSKKSDAVYAMSNTQMPTETRPGHVAMIAGFYEDLSAITTGWKENLVDFDSVFNKSRYTWAWGSPDVLNMFKSKNAFLKTYDANVEDFATSNASVLDTWVFHHLKVRVNIF